MCWSGHQLDKAGVLIQVFPSPLLDIQDISDVCVCMREMVLSKLLDSPH